MAASALPNMPAAKGRSRFFGIAALVMLAMVLLSFPLTYYAPVATGTRRFAPILHIHGLAFFGWMILYAWQSWLPTQGRTALHRELGLAGIALSALLVPLGIAALIQAAARRAAAGDPLPFANSLYNTVDILLFAGLMIAAIAAVTRHRDWHRRFVFAAALCLVGPAISRWIVPYFNWPPASDFAPNILADLFLVALAMHDRGTLGRVHPATWWAVSILVPIHLLTPMLSRGAAWNALAPSLFALNG